LYRYELRQGHTFSDGAAAQKAAVAAVAAAPSGRSRVSAQIIAGKNERIGTTVDVLKYNRRKRQVATSLCAPVNLMLEVRFHTIPSIHNFIIH
jgi:hypothetical protein